MFYHFFRWNPMRADEDGAGAGANEPAGADQNGGSAGTPPAPAPGVPSFDEMLKGGYQAEFDRRVNKAIDTARSKFADPRVAQLQAQVDAYARRDAVMSAGVDARFAKFVASEVAASLGEGEKFEDKLKAYVEANPHFTTTGGTGSWGHQQHGSGGGQQLSGWEAEIYARHPELKKD